MKDSKKCEGGWVAVRSAISETKVDVTELQIIINSYSKNDAYACSSYN